MTVEATIEVTGVAQKAHWAAKTFPETEEVRPGVWSIPVPMGDIPVRYTLAYAFISPEGVLLVDPGWRSEESLDALRAGYDTFGANLSDTIGVIVTHAHFDHFGLARTVQQESGAWAGMHADDIAALTRQLGRTVEQERADVIRWGVPEDEIEPLLWLPTDRDDSMPVPDWNQPLTDGLTISHGNRQLVVLATPGHTAGHICLYVPEDDLLLTGDHVLPRITSHVSDPEWQASPPALNVYTESLRKLASYATAEVLPAHEYRFRDIDARITQLESHHAARGDEVLDVLGEIDHATTWEIAERLTWSRGWKSLNRHNLRMALGETSAHLNLLGHQGQIGCTGDPAEYSLA